MLHYKHLIALFICLLAGITGVSAASFQDLSCRVGTEGGEIRPQQVEGKTYLFLPAGADDRELIFQFEGEGPASLVHDRDQVNVTSGKPFYLRELLPASRAGEDYPVTLTQGRERLDLILTRSENIASLYLSSDDPAQDRNWVEEDKGNKAKGSVILQDAGGNVIFDDSIKQIKGRGNSTWYYPKKPYQIKLKDPADLMENGESADTWILLANYYDRTLLRNTMSFHLAQELSLDYSPHCRPVDLYYDGEYRGSYLLSEKTEVGENRVEVHDLEADIEDANPDITDFDALEQAEDVTAAGEPCRYPAGLNAPADLSGGYLLELDYSARAREEASWFKTRLGNYVVVKSPEFLPKEGMNYISSLWQDFEDAVVSGGVNPETGLRFDQYMDVDSLAKCYLLMELSRDVDSFQSSTYFYKPEGEDFFYAGPVWDFDSAYNPVEIEGYIAGKTLLGGRLLALPDFRTAVQNACEELDPLVRKTLLSNSRLIATDGGLRSLDGWARELRASARQDRLLWPDNETTETYDEAVDALKDYLESRNQWLYDEVMGWQYDTLLSSAFVDIPPGSWYLQAVKDVVDRELFSGVTDYLFRPSHSMTRAMTVTVLYRLEGSPAVETSAPFSDVEPVSWYEDAVNWAVSTGVVEGYPDGTFHPDRPVNRQEIVALLYRYAKLSGLEPASQEIPGTFPDRDEIPDWAVDPFGWAIDVGLINGMGDGRLNPKANTPRSQGAALFQRYCQMLDEVRPEVVDIIDPSSGPEDPAEPPSHEEEEDAAETAPET